MATVLKYLMGNQISRDYDVKEQIGSSGLWRIYHAIKKNPSKHVAVFVRARSFFLFLSFLGWSFLNLSFPAIFFFGLRVADFRQEVL